MAPRSWWPRKWCPRSASAPPSCRRRSGCRSTTPIRASAPARCWRPRSLTAACRTSTTAAARCRPTERAALRTTTMPWRHPLSHRADTYPPGCCTTATRARCKRRRCVSRARAPTERWRHSTCRRLGRLGRPGATSICTCTAWDRARCWPWPRWAASSPAPAGEGGTRSTAFPTASRTRAVTPMATAYPPASPTPTFSCFGPRTTVRPGRTSR